jgi:hypothetical protein
MRRLVLAFLIIAPASCSEPTVAGPDGRECTAPLEDVSTGCPATFDGTEAHLPPCGPYFRISSLMCGELIQLAFAGGFSWIECFYDPLAHDLVGARLHSDTNEYCGNHSFVKTGGRVASCPGAPLSFMHSCAPDAGTVD